MSDAAQEAAAGLLVVDEAEEQSSEQPEDTAAETQQEVETEEYPDEIRRLLDEPDLEDEEEIDTTPVAGEETYYEDEDVDKLKRELAKERKRREHAEQLRINSEIKGWRKEATRYFKYANVDQIEASSRRAFLRKAAAEHEPIKTAVDRAVTEERAALEKARADVETQAAQDQRDAWGQTVQTTGVETRRPVERQRGTGNAEVSFLRSTRERLASGDIKL